MLMLLCIVCLCFNEASAQKQYNRWYFGRSAGLNFNTTPPQALTDGALNSMEGSSGICDSLGNLLFYGNGDMIYNRLHQPMKNGVLLPPAFANTSSMQAAMAIPVPYSQHLYYFITTAPIEYPQDHDMTYSIIDMQGDNGLGEVITARVPLLPNAFEVMAVTRDCQTGDYWIASIDIRTGNLNCVRTVNGLMDTTIMSHPLFAPFTDTANATGYGSMKFSPDGNTLVAGATFRYDSVLYTQSCLLHLFRFDKATGQVSSQIDIPMPLYAGYVEFSPNSRFVYLHTFDDIQIQDVIVQYDLSIWNADSVVGSADTIHFIDLNVESLTGMQLGPDDKIYVFTFDATTLSVINAPNEKGSACDYQTGAISLNGKQNYYGAPYYPTFRSTTQVMNIATDTVMCAGDSMILHYNGPPGHIKWNTGDTTDHIVVRSAGVYWASTSSGDCNAAAVTTNAIRVTIKEKFKVYLGSDTTFCNEFSLLLKAGEGAAHYLWNTGDTTFSIMAGRPGMYAVTIRDSNNCPAGDTIVLDRVFPPQLSLSDTVSCEYVLIQAAPVQAGMQYLWSTGSTAPAVHVNRKGTYSLTVSNPFCSITDSITITTLPTPDIDLGADTSLCGSPQLTLHCPEGESFLWNTGDTSSSITIKQQGLYWVIASNGACTASDTIRVSSTCDMRYYIPNAFTPSGDGLNDVFQVQGTNIDAVTMKIYNRWGAQLFEASGQHVSWDGTFGNEICQQDVYVYTITITGRERGKTAEVTVSGTVTVLR